MKKNDCALLLGIALLGAAAFTAGVEAGIRMKEQELAENEEYIEMLEEEIFRMKNDTLINKIKRYRPARLFRR